MKDDISEIVIKTVGPFQITRSGKEAFVMVPFFRAMTKEELGTFPQLLSNGEIDALITYLEAELQERKMAERRNR